MGGAFAGVGHIGGATRDEGCERGVRLEVVQQSHREDWIQAFVRLNVGIAFMPQSIADAARLAHVRTADCPIVRDVKVLAQAERPLTPAQRPVIDSLAARAWDGGAVAMHPPTLPPSA